MMRQHYLNEDKLPPKLQIIFSSKIIKKMDFIENFNQDNIDALSQWYYYIEGVKR